MTYSYLLQPLSMVLPGVVGFKLNGKLRTGVTATDLVLTITQILRKHGVVGKFVEFYGIFKTPGIYLAFVFIKCKTLKTTNLFGYLPENHLSFQALPDRPSVLHNLLLQGVFFW